MEITVLGCGSSGGVPLLGCRCAVCTSSDPRNQRLRASILIETNGVRLLVDTAPDLRQQALTHGITAIDAVLFTHGHADHTHGIDELRSYNYLGKKPVPVYGTAPLLEKLTQQFGYAFPQQSDPGTWVKPALLPNSIPETGNFEVLGVPIQSFLQYHGKGKSTGYRIGNFAYSTDVDNLPDGSLQLLDSLDIWLVDCLRYEPAPTHAHLAKTLKWIGKVKPKRAILTHMSHAFDYSNLAAELPSNVTPAYDGLHVTIA